MNMYSVTPLLNNTSEPVFFWLPVLSQFLAVFTFLLSSLSNIPTPYVVFSHFVLKEMILMWDLFPTSFYFIFCNSSKVSKYLWKRFIDCIDRKEVSS